VPALGQDYGGAGGARPDRPRNIPPRAPPVRGLGEVGRKKEGISDTPFFLEEKL